MNIQDLLQDYEELANEYEDEIAAINAAIKEVNPKVYYTGLTGNTRIINPKLKKLERELEIAKIHLHYTETFFEQLNQVSLTLKTQTS